MKDKSKFPKWLKGLHHWAIFFLLSAFIITCCITLFITILSETLDLEFREMHLETAAKLTFLNVLLISLLFSLVDSIRRYVMIKRPTKKILEAAEKITDGDFNVHLPPLNSLFVDNEFNQLIECFNKMAKELSSTETLRADFIANVSHELKTPLSVIQNYSTMLQQKDLPEEKRLEYSKGITFATRRLTSLITNILKLNKLENQQIFPSASEFNLSEQLCSCLLQFENEWETKNINIQTDIDDDVKICSDSELLCLVWNNLFSNAIKFTNENGEIFVSLKQNENCITVMVKDNGCGMTEEVGKHIFEKFYQGDTSHSTVGNGLGLALVKRVVDITHGQIHVESTFGKGSTFTVEFRRQPNGK